VRDILSFIGLSCEQLPDQDRHPNATAAALQSRCDPSGLFFVSSPEKADEKQAFETTEGVQAACTAALKAIPENAFRDAFNARKSRWQRCIDAEGTNFESS
jgi:hypothetical protein